MVAAFVGFTYVPSAGATLSQSVAVPTGTANDDVMLALVRGNGRIEAPAPPTGWTVLVQGTNLDFSPSIYYRVAAAEPTSYSFPYAGDVSVVTYRGLHLTSLIAGHGPAAKSTSSDLSKTLDVIFPSLTATSAFALYVAWPRAASIATEAWAPPTGMVERFDYADNAVADERVRSGASGTRTIRYGSSSADQYGGYAVLLNEANHPPNAPIIALPASVNRTRDLVVDVGFSDPDEGDSASKSALRHRPTGVTPVPAWTVVTRPEPNTNVTIPADTLAVGQNEIQGQSTDAAGLTGPWSASTFVQAVNPPPGHTFTSPAAGATIGGASQRFTVSNPGTFDTTEWRVLGDLSGTPDEGNVLIGLTSITSGDLLSFTATGLANSQTVHAQARGVSAGIAGPWATSTHPVSYTPPAPPAASVTILPTALAVTSANRVPVAGEPPAAYNELERGVLVGSHVEPEGIFLDFKRGGILQLTTNTTYIDETVIHGVDYAYRFHAAASNGTRSVGEWVSRQVELATDESLPLLDVYAEHYLESYAALRDVYLDSYTDTYGSHGVDPVTSTVERTV